MDSRNVKILQSLDQTNNGEVYFELIDGSDARSKQTLSYRRVADKPVATWWWIWSSYYYTFRRYEASISATNKNDLKTSLYI